jgi:hypothetical protein
MVNWDKFWDKHGILPVCLCERCKCWKTPQGQRICTFCQILHPVNMRR